MVGFFGFYNLCAHWVLGPSAPPSKSSASWTRAPVAVSVLSGCLNPFPRCCGQSLKREVLPLASKLCKLLSLNLCRPLLCLPPFSPNVDKDYTVHLYLFMKESESASHSVMSGFLQPHGLYSPPTPLSMGFSRREYWSELPCPSPPSFLFLETEAGLFLLTLNSSKLTAKFYSQVWSYSSSVVRFVQLIKEYKKGFWGY